VPETAGREANGTPREAQASTRARRVAGGASASVGRRGAPVGAPAPGLRPTPSAPAGSHLQPFQGSVKETVSVGACAAALPCLRQLFGQTVALSLVAVVAISPNATKTVDEAETAAATITASHDARPDAGASTAALMLVSLARCFVTCCVVGPLQCRCCCVVPNRCHTGWIKHGWSSSATSCGQ